MKPDILPQNATSRLNQQMSDEDFKAECNNIDLYVRDLELKYNDVQLVKGKLLKLREERHCDYMNEANAKLIRTWDALRDYIDECSSIDDSLKKFILKTMKTIKKITD